MGDTTLFTLSISLFLTLFFLSLPSLTLDTNISPRALQKSPIFLKLKMTRLQIQAESNQHPPLQHNSRPLIPFKSPPTATYLLSLLHRASKMLKASMNLFDKRILALYGQRRSKNRVLLESIFHTMGNFSRKSQRLGLLRSLKNYF